jgi:hypothetical protein
MLATEYTKLQYWIVQRKVFQLHNCSSIFKTCTKASENNDYIIDMN